MTDLLPCPNPWCDKSRPEVDDGEWATASYVECINCQMQGPTRETRGEAIAAWNTRPARILAALVTEEKTE